MLEILLEFKMVFIEKLTLLFDEIFGKIYETIICQII